mgnify:CR=1 FL=1|tara:strand:+ start:7740 stop:8177 length:438 start_codon:yes stop_codon:yes gene_type:complete
MAVINSFVNVIAGATVLLGGEPFMDKRIGEGGWTVRRLVGIPLLAIGGVGIVVGYIRNKRVRGQRNDAETFNAEEQIYDVVYRYKDVVASSPYEAAQQFYDYVRDGARLEVFEVTSLVDKETVQVDLGWEEDDEEAVTPLYAEDF